MSFVRSCEVGIHASWRSVVLPAFVVLLALPSNLVASRAELHRSMASIRTPPSPAPSHRRFNPQFERKTVLDGLSFGSVTCIYQDHQGFLWIGTDEGLNRYDGHEFVIYKDDGHPGSLGGSHIEAIAEDRLGRLWVGTNIGGAFRYDRNTRRFKRYDFRSAPDAVSACWHFLLDRAGRFWTMSPRGVLVYDYDRDTFVAPPAATPRVRQALGDLEGPAVADSDGSLWLSGYDAFAQYDPAHGTLHTFERQEGVLESAPHGTMSLMRDGGSGLWITGLKGLQRFDTHTHTFTNFYPAGVVEDERNFLYQSTMDAEGDLWCGSMHAGLVRFDTTAKSFQIYRADPHNPHALPDNRIAAVYRDRDNTIWTGSLAGLALFNESAQHFTYYHHDPTDPTSLSSGPIREMGEDREGRLWIGSDGDGLNVCDLQTGVCTHFRHRSNDARSLSENSAIALTIDSMDRVWVGTWGNGLNLLLKDGTFRHFRYVDSTSAMPSDYLWDLYTDPHGVVWGTTWGGGLLRIDPKTLNVRSYKHDPRDTARSLHSNFVFVVRSVNDTDYWVGTTAGIEHFNPMTGEFTVYYNGPHTATSWMLNNASSVEPAARSRNAPKGSRSLWIANYAGLQNFDPVTRTFRFWDHTRGLPINSSSSIIVADDSSCWISTRAGLVHADPFSDTAGLHFRTYDAADGLESTDFTALSRCATREGSLLFGTVSGLIQFDPHTIVDNPDQPPIVLTAFKLFNKDRALDSDLATITTIPLSYRDNVIAFEFASLNFIRPEWNTYAYKLEGFDREWVYCGNKHAAAYTNLDPGEYQFIVRGTNNDGIWSDKLVSVTLVIAPPFWRTYWFMALVTAILVVALYISHKLRVRHIHERNRMLEEQVKERTQVVAAQRDELQKAYEHLQHAQVQLVQSEKMASLGQLTAGIAHEINNPINFISGNIEPLKRDLEDVLSLMRDYEALLHTSNDPAESDRLRGALEKKRSELQIPALLEEVAALMNGMEEGATRTSTIVRGLRNFSRLDQNALKEVDIEEGLESTISLIESRWRGRIEIERNYDQNARRIECYPGELNQVFMNLLSNAIDAIPDSGSIRITTERQGPAIRISVKDSGQGIDALTLSRIFEPFFTTKPVGTGTGLGLSISYGIIQKHHGTIEFESTPGAGTTAIVTLPVAQPSSDGHPERSEGSLSERVATIQK